MWHSGRGPKKERNGTRCKDALTIQQVIDIVKNAWNSRPNTKNSSCIVNCCENMDESPKKLQQQNSADNGSPILIRRRLSVPETVMRKYILAQQRPDSQNSDYSTMSDPQSHWRTNRTQLGTGSDSNLSSRKRDSDYMRKSTLLRRLWNFPKQYSDRNSRITGTYTEWYLNKLSSGKSTNSLSYHSSPEHSLNSRSNSNLSLSNFKSSNKKTMSPKHFVCDLNKNKKLNDMEHEDIINKNVSTTSSNNFSDVPSSAENQLVTISSTIKTTTTETESERTSTRSIGTSGTAYSENSDRNCCKENLPQNKTTADSSTNLNVISNVHLSQSTLNLIFTQVMHDVEHNENLLLEGGEAPRIINVQQMPSFFLRQATETNDNTKIEEQNKIIKYMISNMNVGDPSTVPRYSTQPKSTSMEVNTSSAESTDKDSDTMSLVDSLEDPTSPRVGSNILRTVNKHDCKPVRGDLSALLPDNSDKKRISPNSVKSEAYFIPFQVEDEEKSKLKTVAELLPDRLREKLSKRQKRRQQRLQQSKNKSRNMKFEEDGELDNAHSVANGDANFNRLPKSKTKQKKLLPSINNLAGFKIDGKGNINYVDTIADNKSRQIKRKALTKFPEPITEQNKNIKTKHKPAILNAKNLYQKIPEITTKTEYVYDAIPKRIYHKTELNHAQKRIEILEIMECVEVTPDKYKTVVVTPPGNSNPKNCNKSKIPVPIQAKLPKLSPTGDSPEFSLSPQKPTFLDLDDDSTRITDPKIDQLIANILIDALHKPDIQSTLGISPDDETHKYVAKFSVAEIRPATVARFQQRFEVIPEEKSSSIEEEPKAGAAATAEASAVGAHQVVQLYKGKEALAGLKDENFTAIPKGWITFYMLRKSDVSAENTSDEGTKRLENKSEKSTHRLHQPTRFKYGDRVGVKELPNKKQQNPSDSSRRSLSPVRDNNDISNADNADTYIIPQKQKQQPETTDSLSSTSDQENGGSSFQHKRKEGQSTSRKTKYHHSQYPPSGWSVTVSGTNTGEFAPELEMRFKFPHANQTNGPGASHSDSGLGEENMQDKSRYVTNKSFEPATIFKETDNITTASACNHNTNNNHNTRTLNRLPDLVTPKNKKKTKRYDCSVPVTRSGIEPRQTRTSYRRYSLHHRSHPHFIQRRQHSDSFRKFPQILTVRGNAVCPEKKPRVLSMTERDLSRNLFR